MKTLESLYIKNVSVFKEAFLPLDTVGITQIRGNNKDSKNNTNKIDVNAVGKSLLLRPISEIIFSSSPTTQDIKSRTKNDMITDSNSEFGLSVRDSKTTYTFSKHANKKTYDYKLLENGKDTKIRTKAYTEEKIKKVFDYSEDEFYSIVFVDSRRTAKLQLGSPTQRIEFFTNLFRLNDYDSVRKIFNSKLSEAKKAIISLKEVQIQIDELDLDNKDLDSKILKSNQEKLKSENEALIRRYEKLHNQKSKMLAIATNEEAYLDYKKLSKILNLSNKAHKQKVELESLIKNIEINKKLESDWDYYNKEIVKYTSKRKRLKEKLSLLKLDLDLSALRAELKTKLNSLNSLKDIEKEFTKLQKPSFDLDSYNALKNKSYSQVSELNKDIFSLESKLQIYLDTVSALSSVENKDECPTCLQKINSKTCKHLSKTYSDKVNQTKSKLKTLKSKLESSVTFEKLKNKYSEYKKDFKVYSELKEASLKASSKIKVLVSAIEKIQDAIVYLTEIENLDEPIKPEKNLAKKIIRYDYKDCVKCLSLLNIIYPILDDLKSVNFNELDLDLEKINIKLKSLNSDLSSSSEKLSKINSKLDLLDSNLLKLKKLNSRKDSLSDVVSEVPVIEAIIEAYSNKGIKLLVIKHIAAMIEKNINQYAPLLYSEPTKFKFDVLDDRNFDIKLCRTINNKPSEMDIRTLSGAEGRAFSFLLPLAILPLIPYERRLNIMVLDEPMQNMSDARKDLFVSSFIPKLNSIVPHLIILSTDNENYPNANVYTVTKEKGVSTLSKS